MATKKKVVKKEPVIEINFWQLSCDIEEVSMRLERVKALLEVVAESYFDTKSDLLWLGSDLLDTEIKKLDEISLKIMEVHKEIHK